MLAGGGMGARRNRLFFLLIMYSKTSVPSMFTRLVVVLGRGCCGGQCAAVGRWRAKQVPWSVNLLDVNVNVFNFMHVYVYTASCVS